MPIYSSRNQPLDGPYAYGGGTAGGGFELGAGFQEGGEDAASDVLVRMPYAHGMYRSNSDGAVGYGVEGGLTRFEADLKGLCAGHDVGMDIDLLAGKAGAVADDETAEIGAQFNLVGVGGNVSDVGTSAHDEQVRAGFSVGVGGSGRLHYGDADGDGYREYGVGADLGPASFDVKTEDPLLTAGKFSPIAPAFWAADYLMGDDANLTEAAWSTVAPAAEAVTDGIWSGVDTVGQGLLDLERRGPWEFHP